MTLEKDTKNASMYLIKLLEDMSNMLFHVPYITISQINNFDT